MDGTSLAVSYQQLAIGKEKTRFLVADGGTLTAIPSYLN